MRFVGLNVGIFVLETFASVVTFASLSDYCTYLWRLRCCFVNVSAAVLSASALAGLLQLF